MDAAGLEPFSVSLGDLDGDGDLDMAVVSLSSNEISVLFNLCDNQTYTADLNGDGLLDLSDVSAFVASFIAGCP